MYFNGNEQELLETYGEEAQNPIFRLVAFKFNITITIKSCEED